MVQFLCSVVPPFFIKLPPKKVHYDKYSVTNQPIECLVDGLPKPTVEWYRLDGNEIPIERATLTSSGSLTFTQIHLSDAGRYVCFASNHYGSVSHEFDIYVTRKRTRKTVDPYSFLVYAFYFKRFCWLKLLSFIAIHGITSKTVEAHSFWFTNLLFKRLFLVVKFALLRKPSTYTNTFS